MAKTISRVGIGSLTQLACRAPQDSIMYSDIDDESTSMFQLRHQQYTYFSSNDEILDFDDDVDFGKTINATLKYGEKFMCDMIGDVFLVLDLPQLEQREIEADSQQLTTNSISESLVFTPVDEECGCKNVKKIAETFPMMMSKVKEVPTTTPEPTPTIVPVKPEILPTPTTVPVKPEILPTPTTVPVRPEVLPTPTTIPEDKVEEAEVEEDEQKMIPTPTSTPKTNIEPVQEEKEPEPLINLKYRVTENVKEEPLINLKYKVKEFETPETEPRISLKYKLPATTPVPALQQEPVVSDVHVPEITPPPIDDTILPPAFTPTVVPQVVTPTAVSTATPTPTPTLTPTPTPTLTPTLAPTAPPAPVVVPVKERPTITPNPSFESMATPVPLQQEPKQTFVGMTYTGVPFATSSTVPKQFSSLATSKIGTINTYTAYQPVMHQVQEPVVEAVTTNTVTQNVYYNNNIGLSLIESISVRSENQVLCEFSGESLDLHNKLNVTKGKLNCMKEMYGIYDTRTSLVENGKTSKQLYINIPLFWNKTFRQFFPLIAMGNSKLEVKVKLRPLSEISNVDGSEDKVFPRIINNCIHLHVGEGDKVNAIGQLKAHLMVQSFILSPLEKKLFLHNKNTFLYKRIYTNTFDIRHRFQRINLNFLHPTEWLAFCYKPSTNAMFEYERLESIRLIFDGVERHRTEMHPEFYRLLQKHNYFENSDNDNIYVYSFCLKAGHGQNSGSINFSKVLNKEIEVVLKKAESYSGTLHVFASSYNFLECDGNSGKLLFY